MPDLTPEEIGASEHSSTPQPSRGGLFLLRGAALLGTAILLIYQASDSLHLQPRQGWGLIVLVAACVGIVLTFLLLLPREAGRLVRHPDLLVPLGLYLPANALLSRLMTWPALSAVFGPSWSFKLITLSFTLSVGYVLEVLLWVVFVGWTTSLVVQAVRQDRVFLGRALASLPRWFLPVLVVELFGWGVLLACLAVALAMGSVSIVLALIVIGVWSLVWNLTTAGLLLVVMVHQRSFFTRFREGLRLSWRMMGRWWLPIVVQMILLGWVTLIYVSYTESRLGGYSMHSKTNWSVNGFWTGSYEHTCRWLPKLMEAADAKLLPLFTTLLSIGFTILAIGIKLGIMTELDRAERPTPDQMNGDPGPSGSREGALTQASSAREPGMGHVSAEQPGNLRKRCSLARTAK